MWQRLCGICSVFFEASAEAIQTEKLPLVPSEKGFDFSATGSPGKQELFSFIATRLGTECGLTALMTAVVFYGDEECDKKESSSKV